METLVRAGLSNAVAATLMAGLVMILSRPLARRPAILHGLWLLVLIKLVTPPIYELPIPWPAPAQASLELSIVGFEVIEDAIGPGQDEPSPGLDAEPLARLTEGPRSAPASLPSKPRSIPVNRAWRWIGLAWLAGSATVLLVSVIRVRRFHRLLKEARRGTWREQDWVHEWARRLGVRRSPDLWWVPGPISPMIWFVGTRPRLIVPHELWKRLDSRQRSTLLAHELAHLRRGDHRVRLLEWLVTTLYWWHPLVWWMRGPIREVEEQCCDAWVVWALPDAVRAYAETVLDTLEFLQPSRRPEPRLASGLGQVPHLKRRLTMIMSGTSRRLPGLPGRLALFAAAAVLLPIGASWAQKPDEKPGGKFIAFTDDRLDLFGDVEVQTTDDSSAPKTAPRPSPVVVRLDANAGEKVELSGSLDDVIRKLEVLIAELKKEGVSKPEAKERAESLLRALDALKKAETPGRPAPYVAYVYLNNPFGADAEDIIRFTTGSPNEKAEQIAKARQEIAGLKKELNAKVEALRKAQARLRELGEDPGDTPLLGWHRSKALGVTVNVPVTGAGPKTTQGFRYTVTRPVARTVIPGSDQERLERLEKLLRDVRSELDDLKKGSAGAGDKK